MRSTGVLNLLTNGILLPTPARLGILEALPSGFSLFSLSRGVPADMGFSRAPAKMGC